MKKHIVWVVALFVLALPVIGFSMEIVDQFPTFSSKLAPTTAPLRAVFDQSLNTSSVTADSFFVTPFHGGAAVPGAISFATTNVADDTAIFTPTNPWPWAARFELHVTTDVVSATDDPFSGAIPEDGLFVANIPNDFAVPIYNPQDPFAIFVDNNVLVGYNPIDPEAPADPWDIPGVNVTGAWKYSTGDPAIIVAIVDDGFETYADPDTRRAFFLNQGELPKPNVDGVECAEYDCNGDGRFDVDDYAHDNRLSHSAPVTALDLIEAFSDTVDNDGNGLVDDICGWDFLRNSNQVIGVDQFPEGMHGGGELDLIADQGDNGIGDQPGVCPNCRVLPIRAGSVLIYDYDLVRAGVRYAQSMGARVINFAGVNLTWSRAAHQAFLDAFDAGALAIAASGDEMTFHHWMPAAGEDVLSVKTIFPMVPVGLGGNLNLGAVGFTETFCTDYGTHVGLSVPARTYCTSDSTGLTSGMVALLLSYAHQQGIELSADEAKQILTMTADDVASHCATIVNLFNACQPGYDMHFGYGRPNLEAAMLAVGDPDRGIAPAIPPSARITSPAWWQTFDPTQTVNLEIDGEISSRVTPYNWRLQIAPGYQPLENDFQTIATGTESLPISGLIGTIPLDSLFPPEWATGVPQNQYSFEATIRLQAFYDSGERGTILGESRKSISVHTDNDPATGLVPGFPIDIGASGESSPLLYDLDGDPDGRQEILFGTGDGRVVALKYNASSQQWDDLPGFPVDVSAADEWRSDSIFGSLAVGDLFGDGTPEIVAATLRGKVYAIDVAGNILDGFPVAADPPDNSSPLTFGHGNGFAGSPVLTDLDNDGALEIVAASLDQKVYAWKPGVVAGGQAQLLNGWPVLCRSDPGLVPADKVCNGNGLPSPIFATPAAGIIDPDSTDPDISQYAAVVIGTGESCTGGVLPTARVYAIYHNGNAHDGGPFLPDWPAMPLSPLGDALPLPIFVGATSSPTIAATAAGTYIGVGTTGWFPELIQYRAGHVTETTIPVLIALNAIGTSSFSSLRNDGNVQYILPVLGVIKVDELGFNLFNSQVLAMDIAAPYTHRIDGQVEDLPLLVTQTVADLDNDGAREAIAGSGGYLIHAFSPNGGEPPGWPKYTQKWVMAAPAVGDIDGDGLLEIVAHTREGWLYAWKSAGVACPNDAANSDWWRYHHDERNTGDYGADTQPPSRVTDLIAELLDAGQIRLTFTATGDDWRCGVAASYDLRYSTDAGADLSDPTQFATATALGPQSITTPGGQTATLTVDAPQAAHFALQARDDAGNLSRVSNDAAVGAADDDTTDDDTIDDDTTGDDDAVSDDDADDDQIDDDADDDASTPHAGDDNGGGGCGC